MCFQEIFLVILIIPLGTKHLQHQTQDLGTKVMIINEMAGSVETCFRICLRCERLAHWLVQQWGGLVGIWDVPSLIDGGTITAPQAVSIT
jgi:hypothetical protein